VTRSQPGMPAVRLVIVLLNLGGKASLSKIYDEYERCFPEHKSKHWEAAIRATLEQYSSDSEKWNGRHDLFYMVEGKGRGVWGLRSERQRKAAVSLRDLSAWEGAGPTAENHQGTARDGGGGQERDGGGSLSSPRS
jgi:hypothetical protein